MPISATTNVDDIQILSATIKHKHTRTHLHPWLQHTPPPPPLVGLRYSIDVEKISRRNERQTMLIWASVCKCECYSLRLCMLIWVFKYEFHNFFVQVPQILFVSSLFFEAEEVWKRPSTKQLTVILISRGLNECQHLFIIHPCLTIMPPRRRREGPGGGLTNAINLINFIICLFVFAGYQRVLICLLPGEWRNTSTPATKTVALSEGDARKQW